RARIVTMFYSSCAETCPLTFDTIRAIEQRLSAAERSQLDVLMITFDPQHDTRKVLRELAVGRRLETTRWTLARARFEDTRTLSQILEFAYRRLDNGTFSHSSALVLIDQDGRSVARTSRIGSVDAQFVAAIQRVLNTNESASLARAN